MLELHIIRYQNKQRTYLSQTKPNQHFCLTDQNYADVNESLQQIGYPITLKVFHSIYNY